MTIDEKDRRYKIVCMATTGWTIIDEHAHNLTKEQCDKWIQDLLRGGANPNYFKVVANNDPKYIDPEFGGSV